MKLLYPLLFLTFYCVLDVMGQPNIIKKEVVNNDTVIWKSIIIPSAKTKYISIYVASDQIKLPSLRGSSAGINVIVNIPVSQEDMSYFGISILTLEEIEYILKCQDIRPFIIDFNVDTEGQVTNIKFLISQNIAFKYNSSELYRIRNEIKKRLSFKSKVKYEYETVNFGLLITKEKILSVYKHLLEKHSEK